MSGSEDCANICGARAGGVCLYRIAPSECARHTPEQREAARIREDGFWRATVCTTPVAPHPIYTPNPAAQRADDFEAGGVLGVPTVEAEAAAEKWRALGWRVTKTEAPHGGVTLLRIMPATSEPLAPEWEKARAERLVALARLQAALDGNARHSELRDAAEQAANVLRTPLLILRQDEQRAVGLRRDLDNICEALGLSPRETSSRDLVTAIIKNDQRDDEVREALGAANEETTPEAARRMRGERDKAMNLMATATQERDAANTKVIAADGRALGAHHKMQHAERILTAVVRDAQHHGRLCGRLLDEIEALGYYTDRLLDPTLYAEAMKAAGREVKS